MAERIPLSNQPYHLYLSRKEFNQMIETLELMIAVDDENDTTKDARKMRDTFMMFAKKQKEDGEDRAAVILYEREACPLIKLLLFYIATFRTIDPKDYYSDIRKNVRRKKDEREKES